MNKRLLCLFLLATTLMAETPPHVILVITDDQGYGDLGSTGNPVVQTPNLDRLRDESTFFDDFHVDPTCAPTRAALMTGRYSGRVGVWHTIQGRNMLRTREITMADLFSQNGYATALFGKWHLGESYPFRPEDRGFDHVVMHAAGGIGQIPDYWQNDYFDDTYLVNGEYQRFEGYCTDIWFEESLKFMRANKDRPFFAYISTNAPHGPAYVPLEYSEPYVGNPLNTMPEFYGMVTNIDDNMARLEEFLVEEGLVENTILIFMTDNGTGYGLQNNRGFDGGMRGKKGSQYDGGHRVPLMIRWPDGKIEAGKEVEEITAHFDLLPTLIDLCDLESPEIAFDGQSLSELIYGDGSNWPERTLVVENQRVMDPIKWRRTAVMTDEWRLVDGRELYHILTDPRQTTDVASEYPGIVAELASDYGAFWADVSRDHPLTSYMAIGSDRAPIVSLTSHDWLIEEVPAWDQVHVVRGDVAIEARWAIEVEQAGEYAFSLRRWPVEVDKGINDGRDGKAFNYTHARMRLGDADETIEIPAGATEVTFKVRLEVGIASLEPLFIGEDLQATPYYVYVTHQPFPGWQTPEGMKIPRYDPDYGRIAPQLEKSN